MNLGLRFKRYRERVGLTQKEAADIIGVNSYQLANYETNRSEPSVGVLKKMSQAYKVSIDNLVGNKIESDQENNTVYKENEELLKTIKQYIDDYLDNNKQ